MTLEACTVITRNRVAHARVLSRSFLEHDPGGRLTALLLDDPQGSIEHEPFRIIRPHDVALDENEFREMAARYSPYELAGALRAWAIDEVLGGGAEAVLYLDSDVRLYASLREAWELVQRFTLVLTPHWVEPPPSDVRHEGEGFRLRGGAFNSGFVGLSAGAIPFLRWWQGRLRRHCLDAIDEGFFVDQRWLDLAPGYFEHHVLRDAGYNVGPWNVFCRMIARRNGRYAVDGQPLRFFHFSGFDPEAPYLLSRWLLPSPHTLLSEHPVLAEMCAGYGDELLALGYREAVADE